jgi:hypothetical protein
MTFGEFCRAHKATPKERRELLDHLISLRIRWLIRAMERLA